MPRAVSVLLLIALQKGCLASGGGNVTILAMPLVVMMIRLTKITKQ